MSKHRQADPAPDSAAEGNDIAGFEAALDELETLVEKLESGQLTLDVSLQQFERGIALVRGCQDSLRKAELKVQILSRDAAGQEQLQDFSSGDSEENDA